MRCYRHQDRDACAICKHCSKGLCAECMVETPGGTACGERCAAELEFDKKLRLRSGRSIALQSEAPRFLAVFLMVVGLGFTIDGLASAPSAATPLKLGTGVAFSLFGIGAYWLWRRYRDANL